ncbi:winged helix-turn-helix transcriptional regulator [Propioniciclava coleopterorum]|uniref:Winged helix-turn-helix transcriptional regulator n=1 Tax=Propioniciclava coleopterorum TaxID=2714937 RepID=A0A6G7Y935_9ACTN|nr:metalloregulator ArsR/SmtB family transcription factor [Propioniciclava coleopterorum]QIK73158.1 winged helix-turn-helix transcriptional regulator [Propioniciclava coleopterorum]
MIADSPVVLCGALADETRWRILCLVGQRAASASELAEDLPVSRQAIAHHLDILARAGLVQAHRQGRQLRYQALGAPLSRLARDLDAIGRGWERRLDRLRIVVEAEQAPGSAAGRSER